MGKWLIMASAGVTNDTLSRPLIGHKGTDTGLWLAEAVCHRTHNCGNILNVQFHTPAHILPSLALINIKSISDNLPPPDEGHGAGDF